MNIQKVKSKPIIIQNFTQLIRMSHILNLED